MTRRRPLAWWHWVIPAAGMPAAWAEAGQPGRLAGLGLAEAAGVVAWPVLLMAVIFGVPALAGHLVPCPARKWWRRGRPRPAVPARLYRAVMAAYRHRCIYCGSRSQPQLDHYRPWSHGGLTSLWNTLVLCGPHNRIKSNYWVYHRSGRSYYKPMEGYSNEVLAAAILRRERLARYNPLRWLYLAWILAT